MAQCEFLPQRQASRTQREFASNEVATNDKIVRTRTRLEYLAMSHRSVE